MNLSKPLWGVSNGGEPHTTRNGSDVGLRVCPPGVTFSQTYRLPARSRLSVPRRLLHYAARRTA
jgi:hypothetical protein